MDAPPDPETPLTIRRLPGNAPRPSEVPLPPSLDIDVDIVELLMEERQRDR